MLRRFLDSLTRAGRAFQSSRTRARPRPTPSRSGTGPRRATPTGPPSRDAARAWTGPVMFSYAPKADGRPDPGEVVWTWIPYEEDPSQGKDRPVVIVGDAGPGLLAVVPLTSKDHTGQGSWLPIGTGPWDREGRPSSVRLDFVLAVPPKAVRREGSVLDRRRFDEVTVALRKRHGWS